LSQVHPFSFLKQEEEEEEEEEEEAAAWSRQMCCTGSDTSFACMSAKQVN
jgi:hypothetical protein